jgi:hypothetical protein
MSTLDTRDRDRLNDEPRRARDRNRDDDRNPIGWAQGLPADRPPRGFLDRRRFVETKWSFRTTELLTLILAVVGVLVAATQLDDLDGRYAWTLVTALAIGYMLSRGVAKAGKGTYADD